MSVEVGSMFPVDAAVVGREGRVDVAKMVSAGPVVVAFHRLWCPFCQQAARELTAAKPELDAAGARVVTVYRDDVGTAVGSCEERGVPFDCVSDPHRTFETAVDVKRFSIARYLAFSPIKLVRALRSGSRPGKATSGFLQGRGTFVIDSAARVVYAHRSTTAADIPAIGDVLAAVRAAASHSSPGPGASIHQLPTPTDQTEHR